EKILCIDIGGGTTDIAAVAVNDMAAYSDEEIDKVTVDLCSKKGDRQFAGDVIDQLLAGEILKDLERQSREKDSPIIIEEVMEAILDPSYSTYSLQFMERMKTDPRWSRAEKAPDPYTVYSLSANVLQAAEEAKRAFSTDAEVTKSFTGAGWPRTAANTNTENFKVVLRREAFEMIVREELKKRFYLLDRVIAGADWEWSSITTLLLTGQSMRSPIIRAPIVDYVREKMGETAAQDLTCVAPSENSTAGNGFDPKICVAVGAAIWGISRDEDDAWITINKSYLGQLTFDLTTRGGIRYKKITGLSNGATLPAEGIVEFSVPRRSLILYRDEEEFVKFNNFRLTRRATVVVESLADFYIVIDGEKYRGERAR
ncbi:MAG TPA: Hsp70 family protein, partial [Thermoanaerobaculia bacterium]|nr:Hsp70 family protein [Thermoanaerobaculia bacterium]